MKGHPPPSEGDQTHLEPEAPSRPQNPLSRALTACLIGGIRLYQLFISPLLGPSCRFQPTCSRYAVLCLSTHGPLRGSWLAVRRIFRCHPWHPGGYDPPPPP